MSDIFNTILGTKMFPSTSICDLHKDVIHTQILSRLDGPTLASLSSASPHLHSLSNEDTLLWKNICHSTWLSTMHPIMIHLITEFPNGPRAFLSQCFPPLITHPIDSGPQDERLVSPFASPKLVSAVDIYYKKKPIFCKVHETVTDTHQFRCSSFRIDLLEPKDAVSTSSDLKHATWRSLTQDLKLSWILVLGGTKAANLSSWKPVSVEEHPQTDDMKIKFVSILSVKKDADVKCEIIVALDEKYTEFCEVSMHLEDLDEITLNGQKSLEILQRAMEQNRVRRKGKGGEQIERYEKYEKRVDERRQNYNRWGKGWRSAILHAAYFWPVLVSLWIYIIWWRVFSFFGV